MEKKPSLSLEEKRERKLLTEKKKFLREFGYSIATKRFKCERCKKFIQEGLPYFGKSTRSFVGGQFVFTSVKFCPRCKTRMEIEDRKSNRKMKIIVHGQPYPMCWKCGTKLLRFIEYVTDQRVELVCENGHITTLREQWRSSLGDRKNITKNY